MSITDAMSRLARAELGVMLETIYAESLWPGMTFEDKDDMLQSMHYQDCCEFVRAFMDPAPIDEAWLREMGFHGCGHRDLLRCQGSNLFYSRGLKQLQWSITPMSGINAEPTRGRFRALLHGLGMEVQG